MSLDLSAEGLAYNSTKVAYTQEGLGAVTLTTFDGGDPAATSNKLILQLDADGVGTPTTGLQVDLPIPSALGVVGGTELVVVNDTNGKVVTFVDPVTSITFNYVNRAGESITLVADGTGDQWVMAF